ncbi:MAG TPA: hypothetical protein VGK67_41790 [Myxococcales bacterium]|jgi:hypothetical protein
MHFIERVVGGRRYRIAAQSVWNPKKGQPVSRQIVLGPADPPPVADLGKTRTLGTRRLGDTGALAWVAEQLDAIRLIDEACPSSASSSGPSPGELTVAVALQRACQPGGKRDLAQFLGESVARVSCLPADAFTGQAFYRAALKVTDEQVERAQIAIAKAAVERFGLSADVLAFDSTNFDTFIATTTKCELPRRGHAKSKRGDLRVVGLGVLVSETGHVPLLHLTYPGNGSDQALLGACLGGLARLHEQLNAIEGRPRAKRTVVRDGGFWSEQLELDLEGAGYHSLISLPLGHGAAEAALAEAAKPGRMKRLSGALKDVRAARMTGRVGDLERTLVVVESQELLRGQKRGIAAALRKATSGLRKLERRLAGTGPKGGKRLDLASLKVKVDKLLGREHLSEFVVVEIGGTDEAPTIAWRVDGDLRRKLERTRLGRRVLCTDHGLWGTERIVRGFRGQWNVEELFRRAKKGGLVPWGPSYQRADTSLRLHTFATVLGLTLVALAKQELGARRSTLATMKELAAIRPTLVRTSSGTKGRRPTVMLAPELSSTQRKAVQVFELDRWMPALSFN